MLFELKTDIGSVHWDRWASANRHVLWGWKRDVENCSRVVYFSADLDRGETSLFLKRVYFFLKSTMPTAEYERVRHYWNSSLDQARLVVGGGELIEQVRGDRVGVTLVFGTPTSEDADRVKRLQLRRPRRRITEGDFPEPTTERRLEEIFPTDIYIGSGMSYECNLPTLCDMHKRFSLDDYERDSFVVGERDELVRWLSTSFVDTLNSFCDVHTSALTEKISHAYWVVRRLHHSGHIRKIFTDNVDNMFSMMGVPYERTRGSGVFNEKHPATFNADNLLVVGVAADRRKIIEQFRTKRRPITVVNPCKGVSPGVQHMNYIRSTDRFFQMEADQFFNGLA